MPERLLRWVVLPLLLACCGARGEPLVYRTEASPPPIYAPLLWVSPSGSAPGFWYTEAQVIRTAAQLDYLTDRAARECWSASVSSTESFITSRPGMIVGAGLAVLTGALLGAYVHQRLTH